MNLRQLYRRNRTQWNFLIGGLILTLALTITAVIYTEWSLYPIWLLAINVITFLFFAADKGSAKWGGNRSYNLRIPEIVLHLFNLLGGFAGGLMAMLALRHKSNLSKHPSFIIIILIAAVLHGLFLWYVYWA